MTRILSVIALGALVVWGAVGWALLGELNVHGDSFLLLYGVMVLWMLGVPIMLSLWVRRRLLAASHRRKD